MFVRRGTAYANIGNHGLGMLITAIYYELLLLLLCNNNCMIPYSGLFSKQKLSHKKQNLNFEGF